MEVFYLVLVFSSFNKGGVDTIPLPYATERACQVSGEAFLEKVTGTYICVPATLEYNAQFGGQILIGAKGGN